MGITTKPAAAKILQTLDELSGTDGIATWPAAAAAGNNVSIAEVLRYIEDILVGTAGVVAFPSSAIPANAVSLAEVLREMYDQSPKGFSNTAVALTGGNVTDVFTIVGGPILLLGLWAFVTTAVSADACVINFQANPTEGASNTDISEGTAGLDIVSAAIGDILALNGDSQDIMVKYANGTDLAMMALNNGGIFVPVGGIDMILSNSAPTTGIADIFIRYLPLARGVTVT